MGDVRPDKVIFGHWNSLSSTKFDYEYNEWLDYSTDNNMYGSVDSAVAIYWEDSKVLAGETLEITTLIGMGDLKSRQIIDGLSVNLTAPKKVVLPKEGSLTFDVSAEINNSYSGAGDLQDLRITIDIPNGVQLIEGKRDTWLPLLKKNEVYTTNWKFRPIQSDEVQVYAFKVTVASEERGYLDETTYVIALPTFKDPPQMQYYLVNPDRMYKDEVFRKIIVKGNNLNYLMDHKDYWDVYLIDGQGKRIDVAKDSVTVESNYEISMFLPDNLALGKYGLGLEYHLTDDNIVEFYRDNAFEITNDISTMRRGYGTLVITEKKEQRVHDGKPYTWLENRIYHFKGTQAPTIPNGENEVMRLTGNIQEMDEGVYSIIPAANRPVYFGKVLKLVSDGESSGIGELIIKPYDVEYKDVFDVYDWAQRVELLGNDHTRIYLDVPIPGLPS